MIEYVDQSVGYNDQSSSALGLNFERVEGSITPTHRVLSGRSLSHFFIQSPLSSSFASILASSLHSRLLFTAAFACSYPRKMFWDFVIYPFGLRCNSEQVPLINDDHMDNGTAISILWHLFYPSTVLCLFGWKDVS
jgi:hypothetical protein